VKTLAPGTAVRALRFTHRYSPLPWRAGNAPSTLQCALLLRGRYWNPAQFGGTEWGIHGGEASRRGVTGGVDEWLGYWPTDLPIAGIAFSMAPGRPDSLARIAAGLEQHPLAAPETEWAALAPDLPADGPAIVPLDGQPRTRALRLRAADYVRRPVHRYPTPEVMPLVRLGPDEEAPTGFVPDPPFAFPVEMPQDGFLAIRVADASGRDVRRLLAEVERPAGPRREHWDLQNDEGGFVEPGAYAWRGITRPPLAITYMNTVYNAGRPPWPAPAPSGWWLADHTPPRAVCCTETAVFIGAPGAEYGEGLIATDFNGVKLWAHHPGVERLVSDGRAAYNVTNGGIVRIDPERDFAQTPILSFKYTEDLPGHAKGWILTDRSGAACHDGRMLIAYDAPGPPWIASSPRAGEVILSQCFPPPDARKVHDTELSPGQRILSAFQMMQSSQQGVLGDATGDGPMAHTLLLTFKRQIPVGSVLVPNAGVQVWALREGKPLPARMDTRATAPNDAGGGLMEAGGDELDLALEEDGAAGFDPAIWQRLRPPGDADGAAVATADRGLRTTHLAFSGKHLKSIPYGLILDRRYRDATPDARMVLLEGERAGPRGWTTTRGPDRPISGGDAPTAGYVWPEATPVRGCAVLEPFAWAGIAIDVWDGAADARIDETAFRDAAHWRTVRTYHKSENSIKFGWHTNTVIRADFGETLPLRALRIRVIEPPRYPHQTPTTARGGFAAVVAFQPIGNDLELPRALNERITIVDLPAPDADQARIDRHLAAPHPGAMAFAPDGTLYVALADGIARADNVLTQKGDLQYRVVVPRSEVRQPRAMAVAGDGLLYILDGASKTIQVRDPADGRLVRSLGGPGTLGPWDPSHLDAPSDMDIDRNGKLWVVDQMYQPKRVSRWDRETGCELELMGGTNYGGGGKMDPGDRTVVYHLGMKFRIDYEAGDWKLESRTWWMNGRAAYSPDRVVRYRGHRYLVGDRPVVIPDFNDRGPNVIICEERDGRAVPLVAAGLVSGLLRFAGTDAIQQAFGTLAPDETSYVWSDRDRNGTVDPAEVQTLPSPAFAQALGVGEDLSLNWGGHRLRLAELRDDGLPLYRAADLETLPELDHPVLVSPKGHTFVMTHKLLDPAGDRVWTYPDHYMSVQASNRTPFGFTQRPAGVLVGSFDPVGTFEIAGERLYCTNGNHGDYFALTEDGLLIGGILGGPAGYGRRYFSGPEAIPGETDLSDLRTTVEDFRGHICRADDGHVYAIAGKSHVTVLRLDGLERLQRVEGRFTVTQEDIAAAIAWAAEKARIEKALRRPAIAEVPYLAKPPVLD
ncbi:MAG: hypothetical protein ACOCX4_07705, partial [Planctomycetota bacterium]